MKTNPIKKILMIIHVLIQVNSHYKETKQQAIHTALEIIKLFRTELLRRIN